MLGFYVFNKLVLTLNTWRLLMFIFVMCFLFWYRIKTKNRSDSAPTEFLFSLFLYNTVAAVFTQNIWTELLILLRYSSTFLLDKSAVLYVYKNILRILKYKYIHNIFFFGIFLISIEYCYALYRLLTTDSISNASPLMHEPMCISIFYLTLCILAYTYKIRLPYLRLFLLYWFK